MIALRCFIHTVGCLHQVFRYGNISKKVFALLIIVYLSLTVSGGATPMVSLTPHVKNSPEKPLVTKEKVRTRYDMAKANQDPDFLREEKEQESMLLIFAGALLSMITITILIFTRQRMLIQKKKNELTTVLLHEKQMALDLESTNKQLTTCTLNLVQKNDLLKAVLAQVNYVHLHSHNRLGKEFYSLKHLLEQHLHHENNWNDFNRCFEKVHSGFFRVLKQKHPSLTSNDFRICALLRLNLNIKEMAALLAISPDSAKMARYRLRQKLNLSTEENLTGYIMSMDHNALPS